MTTKKTFLVLLVAAALALVAAPASAHQRPWSATWARAMQAPAGESWQGPNWSLDGFDGQSLRQELRVSRGGDSVRVTISNRYGTGPLRVTGASIGKPGADGAVRPGTLRPLTFAGRASTTVPAGTERTGDAAYLRVAALERLSITLYFSAPTGPATFHESSADTSYLAAGDHRFDPRAAAFTGRNHASYFLSRVDVGGRPSPSVVTFGDSITDGVSATPGTDGRYPDRLAERIAAAGLPYGVLNTGLSGNELLNDSATAGESGLHRFQHDVLDQPGVRTVVVLEGVNDIGLAGWLGRPLTAETLIDGHRALIAAAHAEGVRIIGATITPIAGSFYDSPEAEAIRDAVNDWIRTGGEYDAVADFDLALAEPGGDRMRAEYATLDLLHPNDAGLAAMADTIDLATL
ncbi:SGNH/GDSL hydrolase family protein [Phytomonospora endophytica]|uniref:Lysophospholipase L1-like esterase n=1 Tax=Phytomonospora endophytica TaxID=714109 RepID=A0A841FJR3_9ACTN|nr:SGNH/GDSL hydrolase family protein [Phytomonospora endophytica]MBB6036075.1 lysophospholipase L1-like esterase [Phytomonospora endophytica]GIG66980.1 SGNH hydrolase [Phytomonospora endophytica]